MSPAVAHPSAEPSVVRIFLLDDTRELRHRVRRALTRSADLTVVGEADDPVDGLPLILDLQPDIVICDLSMPRMDGLEAIPQIAAKAPDAGIVVFSGFLSDALGATALARGADRYVEKSAPLSELAEVVREVVVARRAGHRPEPGPAPEPAPEADAAPPAQRPVLERPLQDMMAEARELRPWVLYAVSIASLVAAAGLCAATGFTPSAFLLLWLAPVLACGALAPSPVAMGMVALSTGAYTYSAYEAGNQSWYAAAVGVLVTEAMLAFAAHQLLAWMNRRVDESTALAAELRRSNAELEHFAYVASHDLAAPLRSVSSFTTMLARRYEGRLDGEADKMIGFITSGAKRMQMMIDDLLAFARASRAEAEAGPFDLGRVVEQVRDDLSGEIAERGATLAAGSLPELVGDEPRIAQVIQNLVANALKFCPPDRPPVIGVSATRIAAGWRIDVRDNGIGIDPRYASKVFGMFQRLHADDDFPGTGIGLAICQRIVERHGGRIWVDGFEGEGCTFSFTIPDVGE